MRVGNTASTLTPHVPEQTPPPCANHKVHTVFFPFAAFTAALVLLWCTVGCRQNVDVHCAGANLVLISIDTLRADRLSLYGYERPTSPNLELLATDSVVFDDFVYSGGGTLPSHMSMMTSLYPGTHGIHPGHKKVLESARMTLAEYLKQDGAATAAFTDGGWIRGKFGFHQGFDIYDDEGGRFEKILPKAFEWLEEHASQRFFLFLHTYDVHSEHITKRPYSCPGGYEMIYAQELDGEFEGCRDERCATKLLVWINEQVRQGKTIDELLTPTEVETISTLYDGCINYVDEQIAEVVELLKSLDVYDSTMIIVTSDHGEEFGEHGMFLHDQGGYEEYARLPLLIKLPHSAFAGTRVPHMATTVDILPTVLDVLVLDHDGSIQGSSLLPTFTENRPVREDSHMYSVLRTDRWKYFMPEKALFDRIADPLEQTSVTDQNPDVVSRLEKRIRELTRKDQENKESFMSGNISEDGTVELTEEEISNLKALGYLDP
jgi:arylsulfatase A-like enzyme